MKPKGWIKEPRRHALASKGVKTAVDGKPLLRAEQYKQHSILPLSEQRKNYEKYVLDSIDASGYEGQNPKTDKEKLQFLKDTFKSEYGFAIKQKGERKAFEEWISGLPSSYNIEFYNNKILELAKKMGSLSQNPTEKQEDQVIEGYFGYMTNQTFRLFEKNGVK